MFGKESKKKELINNLGDIFTLIQREHQISPGDFPNLERMKEQLQHHDFTKFHPIKPQLLKQVDAMLANDIARLMQMIPLEDEVREERPVVKGGAFENVQESPFGIGKGEGADKGRGEEEWEPGKDRYRWDEAFNKLNPMQGKVTGAAAKNEMLKSKLPNNVLGKVWKLADIDRDGMLDADEFALAMHLIYNVKLEGHDLPQELPSHLIPPHKQDGFSP